MKSRTEKRKTKTIEDDSIFINRLKVNDSNFDSLKIASIQRIALKTIQIDKNMVDLLNKEINNINKMYELQSQIRKNLGLDKIDSLVSSIKLPYVGSVFSFQEIQKMQTTIAEALSTLEKSTEDMNKQLQESYKKSVKSQELYSLFAEDDEDSDNFVNTILDSM